ncbi:hypothetical protein DXG01_003191 [Tephrocybe rancida]|nr:hypothetical protein DXG01_003191 [Tephrocybe rancida]
MLEQPSGRKPLMAIIEGMNREAQAKLVNVHKELFFFAIGILQCPIQGPIQTVVLWRPALDLAPGSPALNWVGLAQATCITNKILLALALSSVMEHPAGVSWTMMMQTMDSLVMKKVKHLTN